MNTITALREELVDLDYVECGVTVSRPLLGGRNPIWSEASAGVARVNAKATLHLFDVDEENVDAEPQLVTVAQASGYTVDLDRVRSTFDALDPIDAELANIAEAIDGEDGILAAMDEMVSQVIVIEHLEVDERYRGQRLGPRLLATLIDTVASGAYDSLVVLRAMPLQWRDLSEIDLRRAKKKLAAAYTGIGFKPFRDDLYWKHTAFVGFEALED